MVTLKNDYSELEKTAKPKYAAKAVRHPLFGYIVLTLILMAVQLLFIFGDGIIPLNVTQAIMQTMIYVVAGLGVGILLMMAGLMSFGTGAFIGLGTYMAAYILKDMVAPYTLILAIVAVAAVLIGIVVGFISLRVRGMHLIIITLALATVLYTLYYLPNSFTGGALGVSRVPFPELFMFLKTSRDTIYFVILFVMFLLIVITMNIINSPMGRAMLSMSNSESLAQAMGINLLKYRLLAFIVATVFSMLSGVLYISYMQSSIYATWTSGLAMNILIAVILGGTAKPAGVLIGSFVIFTVDYAFLKNIEFFQKNPQASLFFNGIVIILIIAKYPGGLIRLLGSIRNGAKQTAAKVRLYRYGPEK
ncbi:MAG: branched-chain amino acid ABC transporter permease [Oscillospiraceae bacterium]|jgi:branched-chain amino acid transport system permease protein|nr:branched-chain amino acid ABC transporter permease [Oscillospiraceae bacterium]